MRSTDLDPSLPLYWQVGDDVIRLCKIFGVSGSCGKICSINDVCPIQSLSYLYYDCVPLS